jgi:hypothetical protein
VRRSIWTPEGGALPSGVSLCPAAPVRVSLDGISRNGGVLARARAVGESTCRGRGGQIDRGRDVRRGGEREGEGIKRDEREREF